MPGYTKANEKWVERAEKMIKNGQRDPELAEAMAKYGYDEARWDEGEGLLNDTKAKIQGNARAYAIKLGMTDKVNTMCAQLWEQTDDLAQLGVAVFKGNTEQLDALGLHKRRNGENGFSQVVLPQRKKRFVAYVNWARHLYEASLTNEMIGATLADFGYSAERLAQEAAEVEALAQLEQEQEVAKAQATQSTAERDEAVEELKAWLFQTERIAKVALRKKRRLLKSTGMPKKKR
jgi:hypothetical protein